MEGKTGDRAFVNGRERIVKGRKENEKIEELRSIVSRYKYLAMNVITVCGQHTNKE